MDLGQALYPEKNVFFSLEMVCFGVFWVRAFVRKNVEFSA